MKFDIGAVTNTGKTRNHNEDSCLYISGNRQGIGCAMLMVADGMGGLANGQMASHMLIQEMQNFWDQFIAEQQRTDLNIISAALDQVIYQVHRMLYEMTGDQQKSGTTLSLLFIYGDTGIMKQVGDSRIYRIYEGMIRQLTEDQTYENYLIRTGQMKETQRNPWKNQALVNAIGVSEELDIATKSTQIRSGLGFLLATDGFYHGQPFQPEYYNWKNADMIDAQSVLNSITAMILTGPASDNLTAVLVKIK